ncbi:hypothetical protein [Sodalis sp. (in: enterobacteria)]|uniref:hypothetical protein n=1 Tax=Sodalis sp. (in: enterobacteria) TaxID=1898979 RepID=UPI003F3EC283
MPCTAWADQKWSTIPRSYLAGRDERHLHPPAVKKGPRSFPPSPAAASGAHDGSVFTLNSCA